jgi:hypothetical protein
VQLSNCSFWGPSPVAARVDGTGTASFNQCTFFNHGGGPSRDQDPAQADAYTLEILGGVGLIHGCRFGVDRPDVMLGERVTAATITGNAFLGGKQITTQTDGDVQEGFNVVVPMRPRTRPAKKEDGP